MCFGCLDLVFVRDVFLCLRFWNLKLLSACVHLIATVVTYDTLGTQESSPKLGLYGL